MQFHVYCLINILIENKYKICLVAVYNRLSKCEVQKITKDKGILDVVLYDAVVMHGAQYIKKDSKFPKARSPNQIYTYYNMESPLTRPLDPPLNRVFNITITYRLDSHIPIPYFNFKYLDDNIVAP